LKHQEEKNSKRKGRKEAASRKERKRFFFASFASLPLRPPAFNSLPCLKHCSIKRRRDGWGTQKEEDEGKKERNQAKQVSSMKI
jgi:hypothetical protein